MNSPKPFDGITGFQGATWPPTGDAEQALDAMARVKMMANESTQSAMAVGAASTTISVCGRWRPPAGKTA